MALENIHHLSIIFLQSNGFMMFVHITHWFPTFGRRPLGTASLGVLLFQDIQTSQGRFLHQQSSILSLLNGLPWLSSLRK
jgi:hypothetical protein